MMNILTKVTCHWITKYGHQIKIKYILDEFESRSSIQKADAQLLGPWRTEKCKHTHTHMHAYICRARPARMFASTYSRPSVAEGWRGTMSGILSEQKAPKQNAIMISPKDGWSKLPHRFAFPHRECRYNVLRSKVPPRLARRTRYKFSFTHRSEIDAYGNDNGTDPRSCGIL